MDLASVAVLQFSILFSPLVLFPFSARSCQGKRRWSDGIRYDPLVCPFFLLPLSLVSFFPLLLASLYTLPICVRQDGSMPPSPLFFSRPFSFSSPDESRLPEVGGGGNRACKAVTVSLILFLARRAAANIAAASLQRGTRADAQPCSLSFH